MKPLALNFRSLWAFFRKDIEDSLRSYALVFILLGPVLLSVFLARFFAEGDVRLPNLVVCDRGNSAFVQSLKTVGLFQVNISQDWSNSRQMVLLGKAAGCVLIPKDFDKSIKEASYPELKLTVNESSITQAAIVREGVRAALRLLAKQDLPCDIQVEKINEFRGKSRLAILPMWIVFTCLGGLMVTSTTLVEEIENKTFLSVLMTPASIADFLIGKVLVGAFLSFIASLLVVLLNNDGFGNVWALSILLVLGSLVFSGLGVVLALITKNQTSASAVSSLLYMLLLVPCALADMSAFMRNIALFTPTWFLYDGVNKALFTSSALKQLSGDFLGLAISGLVCVLLGYFTVKYKRVYN